MNAGYYQESGMRENVMAALSGNVKMMSRAPARVLALKCNMHWKARMQKLPSMRKPYCVHFRFPFTDTGKGEDRISSENKVQCILN